MYPPHTLARVIARNIRKTWTPLGIPASKINTWWSDEDGSDIMFYTGLMYQMMPYITKLTQIMHKFEGSGAEKLVSVVSTFSSPFSRFLKVDDRDKQYFNSILWKISELLIDSEVEFFYDPELDFYSGILLYEMGDDESFAEYASFVAERLKEQGVRKVVTVDPHTTYALKVLYPQFTGISFEVKTYLEVLKADENKDSKSWKVAFHDPCYYARCLEMHEVPRKVLQEFGLECIDIRNSGRLTSCCGGPIESFSPKLSMEISRSRYMEMKGIGCDVVTSCPICLGNFRVSGDVKDIAEVLWRARRRAHDRS
jgi:Fe-S oxidoreductase